VVSALRRGQDQIDRACFICNNVNIKLFEAAVIKLGRREVRMMVFSGKSPQVKAGDSVNACLSCAPATAPPTPLNMSIARIPAFLWSILVKVSPKTQKLNTVKI
jgi:hypothetical protein